MKKKERFMEMMKNNLEIFNRAIQRARTISICSHVNSDGDAVGSSTGLYLALKDLGKEVYLIRNDNFPTHLEFLNNPEFYTTGEAFKTDLFIVTDVASPDRIGSGVEFYNLAKDSLCIDHHKTNDGFCINNIIEPHLSSTSELIASMLLLGGYKISKLAATYLYLGITTDSNRFQYESTDSQTLRVAADLLDKGADKDLINNELFETLDTNLLFLQTEIIKSAEYINDGKFIIARLTTDLREKYGLDYDQSEGIVSLLRSIKGVELSCLVKEQEDKVQKISLRSQEFVDVSEIAKEFGGGGHIRAAGCTINSDNDTAYKIMYKRLKQIDEGDTVNQ